MAVSIHIKISMISLRLLPRGAFRSPVVLPSEIGSRGLAGPKKSFGFVRFG